VSRYRSSARGHVRPMAGWWTKNPYFVRYMLREGTALFLTVYALTLLVGLVRLGQGAAAFEAWRAALASPLAIAWHVLALLMLVYHSWTWFKVMPKTAPELPVDPRLVTVGGCAAAVLVSVAILAALRWSVA
jgi:fumarate reductase subunit C